MSITDESSDSESDEALLADIHDISKAFYHTAPEDACAVSIAGDTGKTSQVDSLAFDSSDSEDDFQFLREAQQKYPGSQPNFIPPTNSDSEDDDDIFEVVRAIQSRFGQYSASGTNGGQVGESKGMLCSNNGLNLPETETLNDVVGDRFDGNEEVLATPVAEDVDKKPELALAFIDTIRKNRLAQRHIRSQMTSLDARMEKLNEIIKRVKIVRDFDVQGRRRIAQIKEDDKVQLISVPNKDKRMVPAALKIGPQENARVVNYRTAFEKYPQYVHKERWTKEERKNLQKGIIQQLQKSLLLKSMDKLNDSEGVECTNGVDEVMSMIGDIQVDPQTIKLFLPNVDWNELVVNYLPRRSGQECRVRWINFEDPLINREEWTRLEELSLLNCIQNLGFKWPSIAESLGTNRTPYQCLIRYQRSLNPSLIKRVWTPSEDAELTTAVETYGESNWTVVAGALEGRTAPQCSNRWMKTLLPSKQKKGRWSPEEDQHLKIAVTIIGSKCWHKIAEFVPGRTQARCRDRWVNNLDPSLNFGKWTDEEDARLEEAIRVHNYCWAKIATCVPPRTDSQCRRRWRCLFPDEALQVQAKKKLIRDALPSNFVDREPNRPTLGPSDFVPLALETTEVDQSDSSRKGKKKQTRRKGKKNIYKVSDTAFCNFPKKPRSGRCRSRRVDICWKFPVSFQVDVTTPNKRRRARGSHIKQNNHAADSTLAAPKKSVEGVRKNRKGGKDETASQCKHPKVNVQRENSVINELGSDLTLAVSKKSVKGARKKVKGEENEIRSKRKHDEVEVHRESDATRDMDGDSTLAVLKKSVKGTSKKRKGGETESMSQCKHDEVEVHRESGVTRDMDGDSPLAVLKKSVKGTSKKRKGGETESMSQCKYDEVLVQRETVGSVSKSGSYVVIEEHQELVASISELGNCTDNIKQDGGVETSNRCKRRKLSPIQPEEWEDLPLASVFEISAKLRTRKV